MKVSSLIFQVEKWCDQNYQSLNIEKSKILKTRSPLEVSGISIRQVKSQKTLGVTLNSRLTWDDHINAIYKKACQRLHLLRVLKMHIPVEELHQVYQAAIRSLFDYCCPVFVCLPKKLSNRIRRLEKRAHKIIAGEDYQCNCVLDGLVTRRHNMSLKLFNEIRNNEEHLLYNRLPQISQHSSRLSNFQCRSIKRLHSFFPQTTILHNSTL